MRPNPDLKYFWRIARLIDLTLGLPQWAMHKALRGDRHVRRRLAWM